MPKQSSSMNVLVKQPEQVVFFHGRPSEEGVTHELLTPQELGNRLGFTYQESLCAPQGLHKQIQRSAKWFKRTLQLTNGVQPGHLYDFSSSDEFNDCMVRPFQGVVLGDLGPPFGVCAFAAEDMPAGRQLGFYAGEYTDQVAAQDEYTAALPEDMYLSAERQGGIARFFPHLTHSNDRMMEEHVCKPRSAVGLGVGGAARISMIKKKLEAYNNDHMLCKQTLEFEGRYAEADVACANIMCDRVVANGLPVVVLSTCLPIKEGEILGFDYGTFFLQKGTAPDLCTRFGQLIPRSAYKRTGNVAIPIEAEDGTLVTYIDRDALYAGYLSAKQPPIPTPWSAQQTRYLSVYEVMDKLVAVNAFSECHGRLPLNAFASALKLYCERSGIKVDIACYSQNPEAVVRGSDDLSACPVDTIVWSRSKKSTGELSAMLKPMMGNVKWCDKTHVFRLLASNLKVWDDYIYSKFSGRGNVASQAIRLLQAGPADHLPREVQQQIHACRASMFHQVQVAAIQNAHPVEVAKTDACKLL